MPITLELIRGGHVLLRTLTDPLDAGEMLYDFRQTAQKVIAPSPHLIHIIVDATNLHQLPSNLLTFWRGVEKTVLPQTGQIIIVSNLGFLKTITSLVSHVTHLQPIAVSTLDEALALVDRLLAKEADQITEDNPSEARADS